MAEVAVHKDINIYDQIRLLREVLSTFLLEPGLNKRDLELTKREVDSFLLHVQQNDLFLDHPALEHYFNHLVREYHYDRAAYRHSMRYLNLFFDYAHRFHFPHVTRGFVASFIEQE